MYISESKYVYILTIDLLIDCAFSYPYTLNYIQSITNEIQLLDITVLETGTSTACDLYSKRSAYLTENIELNAESLCVY